VTGVLSGTLCVLIAYAWALRKPNSTA